MATSLCYGEIRPLKNQNLKQSTVVHKKPIKTPPFLISLHFLQPLIKMLQHVLSLARGGVIISPQFSHQLHWLPVCQWIHFKIAGCVFQALTAVTGQAPTYFANDCHLISDSDRRRLRSSDIRTRVTPWTCTQFGDRSFLTPVPHIWNGLPSVLWVRTDLMFDHFKRGCRPICLHWCDEISVPSVSDLCPCGETQTMSHSVESCPLTKLNGGLSRLHSADEDTVSWLTNYGSWHIWEEEEEEVTIDSWHYINFLYVCMYLIARIFDTLHQVNLQQNNIIDLRITTDCKRY